MILDKKDETPLSTMKFSSDTLDEQQEKDEFFRVKKKKRNKLNIKQRFARLQDFEKDKDENRIDYGILNHQMEFDLSPTRNGTGKK